MPSYALLTVGDVSKYVTLQEGERNLQFISSLMKPLFGKDKELSGSIVLYSVFKGQHIPLNSDEVTVTLLPISIVYFN